MNPIPFASSAVSIGSICRSISSPAEESRQVGREQIELYRRLHLKARGEIWFNCIVKQFHWPDPDLFTSSGVSYRFHLPVDIVCSGGVESKLRIFQLYLQLLPKTATAPLIIPARRGRFRHLQTKMVVLSKWPLSSQRCVADHSRQRKSQVRIDTGTK